MKHEYLEAGRISGTYSFKGEVRVANFCDSADFFKKIKTFYLKNNGGEILEAESVKVSPSGIIVKFKEKNSEEDAKKLVGKILWFCKEDVILPSDTYFIDDLIGLAVFDNVSGKQYGVLAEVIDNGAHQVFIVSVNHEEPASKQILIPNVKQFVKKMSVEEGIFVELIEGMAD